MASLADAHMITFAHSIIAIIHAKIITHFQGYQCTPLFSINSDMHKLDFCPLCSPWHPLSLPDSPLSLPTILCLCHTALFLHHTVCILHCTVLFEWGTEFQGSTEDTVLVLYNQYWRWDELCSSGHGALNLAGEVNFMY
jgi:hypothetical protein